VAKDVTDFFCARINPLVIVIAIGLFVTDSETISIQVGVLIIRVDIFIAVVVDLIANLKCLGIDVWVVIIAIEITR